MSASFFRPVLQTTLSLVIAACLAGCAGERNRSAGDPHVRVSVLATAGPLAALFGNYQIFEVGDSALSVPRSPCDRASLSPTDPAAPRFTDPATLKPVTADAINLQVASETGACVAHTIFIFREVGSWTETTEGDRYEFVGELFKNNERASLSTAVTVRQVGGPRLLRLKIQSEGLNGSYLIFKR